MDDVIDTYDDFLGVLRDLVEEVEKAEADEDVEDLGGPAAELGPLADAMVAALAHAHAKDPAEEDLMVGMRLDELLSYLGEKRRDADVSAASRAAARILAMLRWFHYGSFARPHHDEGIDWEEQADLLKVGLDRLFEPSHDGSNTHG